MREVELKPCPFCGCPVNLTCDNAIFAWHSMNCFFSLLEEGKIDISEEIGEAFIKSWNRRVSNDE